MVEKKTRVKKALHTVIVNNRYFIVDIFWILFHHTCPQKYCIHTIDDSLIISFYSDIFICLLNQTPHLRGYVWLFYLSLYVCYITSDTSSDLLGICMAALPIFICLLLSDTSSEVQYGCLTYLYVFVIVIHHPLVYLIRQTYRVILFTQVCHHLELISRENLIK